MEQPTALERGRRIAARRAELGLSGADVEERSGGEIYQKLLYRLESGKKDVRDLALGKAARLMQVLRWSPDDIQNATGVPLPSPAPASSETAQQGALDQVAAELTSNSRAFKRESPGASLRARRKWLGLTQADLVDRTDSVLNIRMVTRMEAGEKGLDTLAIPQYAALLGALEWSPAEFAIATGAGSFLLDHVQPAAPPTHLAAPLVSDLEPAAVISKDSRRASQALPVDLTLLSHKAINTDRLAYVRVTSKSLVSETVMPFARSNSLLLIEFDAEPASGDAIVADVAGIGLALIRYPDVPDAVLRTADPGGPLARIGSRTHSVVAVARLVLAPLDLIPART